MPHMPLYPAFLRVVGYLSSNIYVAAPVAQTVLQLLAIARLAVTHGYNVVISNSRGPETLSALIAELGPKGRAAMAFDAAKAGDIVVVTVPLKNYRSVPVEPLAGKVVEGYWKQLPSDADHPTFALTPKG